jgi:hypothetical protein
MDAATGWLLAAAGAAYGRWPSRSAAGGGRAPARAGPLPTWAACLLAVPVASALPAAPLAPETAHALCDRWAAIAAAENGVPLELMRAIARVETGHSRTGRAGEATPWPWTVNAGGRGFWLESREDAVRLAKARRAAGEAQIDVGCFQINHKWHGRAFASFDEMMDPARNARYAARFLAALHAEFGDWSRAAAAYHSREPERGRAYLRRLAAALQPAGPGAADSGVALPAPRPGGALPAPGPGATAPMAPHGANRRTGPSVSAPRAASVLGSLVTLAPTAETATAAPGAQGAPGALMWRQRP